MTDTESTSVASTVASTEASSSTVASTEASASTVASTEASASTVASTEASSSTVASTDPATRLFSRSIVISGVRCMLAYVVFPWILPLLGVATGVGPFIGIVVGVVAIGFNVASIRRFWISKHRWRHAIAVLNSSVIVLLTILLWIDLRDLVA